MSDQIVLTGIRGFGHHGVLSEERRDGQEFSADVVLTVDTRPAAVADDLNLTVDYSKVAADTLAVIVGEPVDLIETVAQRIADRCLSYPGVQGVQVTIHKPQAPVGVPVTDVQLRITRP
jgi:dihydroneopterin aldolase/2-amino-4-hydroxy-6-hydroxymethyldihydropteridine diphosphokinase